MPITTQYSLAGAYVGHSEAKVAASLGGLVMNITEQSRGTELLACHAKFPAEMHNSNMRNAFIINTGKNLNQNLCLNYVGFKSYCYKVNGKS